MTGAELSKGVVLEASPLPKWRVSALEQPETGDEIGQPHRFGVSGVQSPEDRKKDASSSSLSYSSDGWRQPFVLLIDDVVRLLNWHALRGLPIDQNHSKYG